LIEQGADAEQIAAVFGWTARSAPTESAQTGHNQTLTAPQKCGIIKVMIRRYVRRKKQQEVKKMAKMYIESDNGGRSVVICTGKKWYMCDCAPWGRFGDVDILDGTEQDAARRMRKAIKSGDLDSADDYARGIENDYTWERIDAWDGMDAGKVEEYENNGRDCDFMALTKI
jgi:hypothetical protein